MHCYTTETIHFKNPTLKCVPVSYLITMCTSKRRKSYIRQLEVYKPTAIVHIVHNRGYSVCSKTGVSTPAQDLWHANKYIASHSGDTTSVLIMEDDILFTDNFLKYSRLIDKFIIGKGGTPFAYSLGMIGLLTYPVDKDHICVLSGGFAHGVVYSRQALNTFSSITIPTWGVHDLIVYTKLTTYCLKRPCAVQKYERTENAKNWDCLHMFEIVDALCKHDPRRLFYMYNILNNLGGLLPITFAMIVLLYRSRFVKLRSPLDI